MARECWEEMRERAKRGVALKGWEEKRKDFLEARGWKVEEMEELRKKGLLRGEELRKRESRIQKEESWNKIKNSRSNK